MKTILMSIRKDPFEALLDGRKRNEFRRRFYIKEPCQVVFYVSSPISAICGVGIFNEPINDTVDNLVKIIKEESFSSPESLRTYLSGLETGYALPIREVRRIKPITLNKLKEEISGFTPPQSYYKLDFNKFRKILGRLYLYETPNEII